MIVTLLIDILFSLVLYSSVNGIHKRTNFIKTGIQNFKSIIIQQKVLLKSHQPDAHFTATNYLEQAKKEFSSAFKIMLLGATGLVINPKKAISSEYNQEELAGVPVESDIVVKRPTDERDYKAFQLKNGLRVLVISDPTSSRAAAAIDVNVGSLSDPIEIPGLAHFCEHVSTHRNFIIIDNSFSILC